MVRVKICGITNLEDAVIAADAGADALGFNFWRQSPRYIRPERAREIIGCLPPFVTPVGLFVNEPPDAVARTLERTGARLAQLHGDESPDYLETLGPARVLKAVRVGPGFKARALKAYRGVAAFVLDAADSVQRGGAGRRFHWPLARAAGRYGHIIVAGGLTPQNVAAAIAAARPFGVDVCTGVEARPGFKDHRKLREFIARARGA